jgi:hypothetical protein
MLLSLLSLHLGHKESNLFFRDAASIHDAGYLTPAQNQNPVAQLQKHIQILAHVNHGHTLGLLLV